MKLIHASSFVLVVAFGAVVLAQDATPPPAAETPPPAAETPPPAAEEAPPAAETSTDPAIIPVPYSVTRYEAAWAKNPFLRKTIAIVQEKESVLKDWALNGMAEYDGKIRVTMVNKQTGEYKHVTNHDSPDADFKLVQANFNRNRADASAEIEKGGEKATIKYDENLTSKPLTINNTQRQAQGAPGQPGQPGGVVPGTVRPGQPGQPGQPVQANRPGGVQAVVNQPGMAPGTVGGGAGGGQPVANTPVAPGATAPPTISRRRQLVPVPPPPAPNIPPQ